MLLSTRFQCRRLLSSLRGQSSAKSIEDKSPPSGLASEDSQRPSELGNDVTIAQSLLQKLRKSGKLSNAKAYNPPSNVAQIVERVVRNNIPDISDWKSAPLTDARLKFKVLTELSSEIGYDVPNFHLANIKSVENVIGLFESPSISAVAAAATKNPLEELDALQQRGELPANIHVQLDYDGYVVTGSSSGENASDEDPRSKIYTGVDNIVTSLKYRRKYSGYAAKIKEPKV